VARVRRLTCTTIPGLALLLLAASQGCTAKRSLTIRSAPPGARVRIDDRAVGVTPIRIAFQHYGVRRITLYKDGYRTHSQRIRLSAPWYARFPIDLFTEILLPLGIDDHREYSVPLVPGEEMSNSPSLRSVIERANVLREAGPEGPSHLPDRRPMVIPAKSDPATEDGPGEGAQRGEKSGAGP